LERSGYRTWAAGKDKRNAERFPMRAMKTGANGLGMYQAGGQSAGRRSEGMNPAFNASETSSATLCSAASFA
jgi:hypothetical protein